MVSEKVCYEGNGQRRGEGGALDQSEEHDNENKCKIQVYTRVATLRMTGKKILQNTDQKIKVNLDGGASVKSNAHICI